MTRQPKYKTDAIALIKAGLLENNPVSTLSIRILSEVKSAELLKLGRYSLVLTPSMANAVIHDVLNSYRKSAGIEGTWSVTLTADTAKEIAIQIDDRLRKYPLSLNTLIELPPLGKMWNIRTKDGPSITTMASNIYNEYLSANSLRMHLPFLKIRLPSKHKAYLSMPALGIVSEYEYRFEGVDPIYIYKAFYAILFLNRKIGYDSSQLRTLDILVFSDSHKYMHTISRTGREAEFITSKKFTDDVKRNDLKVLLNQINALFYMNESDDLTQAHKNRITNSLYWCFESISTLHMNMAAMSIVSAFDAFFDEKDNRVLKTRVISEAVSSSPKENAHITKLLEKLYAHRNEIAHGERAMYSFVASEEGYGPFFPIQKEVYDIYRRFLQHQLKKINLL